jgi:hypothetical protein
MSFFVFVVMPFSEKFKDIYEVGIRPACEDAGAKCERVDEQMFLENILSRIYGQIAEADIIVSEVTGRTPNVLYETGYAHGIGKRVIFLTQNAADIPFDLMHYPHIIYGQSIATLKKELEQKIRWCIENPPERPLVLGSGESELSRMAKHIRNYMRAKNFTMVSFWRIREAINQNYSDDLLLDLIDKSPDTFRRVRIKGGKPGIGLVTDTEDVEIQPAADASGPNLTETAKVLLLNAAKDAHGRIVRIEAMGHFQVQTNGQEFVAEQTPRAKATVQAAMDELEAQGLIKDASYHKQVYEVTEAGHRVADILTQQ